MEISRSESIGKLTEALAKAQLNFKPVIKDASNPFFKSKYADLATLIEATRPALAAEGLAVIQVPLVTGGMAGVSTILSHASGEFLAYDLILPVAKLDAQGIGSAQTYARRYSYQAALNLAGEDDDDGNAASGKPGEKAPAREVTGGKPPSKDEGNAAKLVNVCKRVNYDMGKASLLMVQKFNVKKADELTPLQLNDLITTISQQAAQ